MATQSMTGCLQNLIEGEESVVVCDTNGGMWTECVAVESVKVCEECLSVRRVWQIAVFGFL